MDVCCSRTARRSDRPQARTLSETRGFLKSLVEVNSDRILGFAAFAVDGGEIMSSVQIAMIAGLRYTALREAILAHPTLVEGLIPLFSSAPSLAVYSDARAADRVQPEVFQ